MSDSFATLGSGAHHASLSMELFRQEYWSELPFPSHGDLPDPGVKHPLSPVLVGGFFAAEPPGKSLKNTVLVLNHALADSYS